MKLFGWYLIFLALIVSGNSVKAVGDSPEALPRINGIDVTTESGQTVRLENILYSQPTQKRRPAIVFFWASWCLPCKNELKEVAHSDFLNSQFELLALSVDQPSDQTAALLLLKEVGWKAPKAFDFDGKNLERSVGNIELPKTYLLDSSGNTIAAFDSFSEQELKAKLSMIGNQLAQETPPAESLQENQANKIESPAKDSQEPSNHGDPSQWILSENAKYRRLRQKNQGKQDTLVSSTGLNYSSKMWSAGFDYRYLNQSGLKEDQIQRAFIEKSGENWKATLGDTDLLWLNGSLIYVQENSNPESPALLRGGLASYQSTNQWGSFQAKLAAGKVENSLYSNEIDVKKDISVSLPPEEVQGFLLNWNSNNSGIQSSKASEPVKSNSDGQWSLELGGVNYRRSADVALSYPTEYKDYRGGASVGYTSAGNLESTESGSIGKASSKVEQWGLKLSEVRFFPKVVPSGLAADNPHSQEARAWLKSGRLSLPLSWIVSHAVPDRSRQQTVIDSPANSLSGKILQQWKMDPQWTLSDHESLQLIYANEKSVKTTDRAWQRTWGAIFTSGEDKKLKIFVQDNKSEATGTAHQEQLFQYNSDIPMGAGGNWSGQVLLKRYLENSVSSSQNFVLGIPVYRQKKVFAMGGLDSKKSEEFFSNPVDQINLNLKYTHQEKQYLLNSGLSDKDLVAGDLAFKFKIGSLKLSYGQAPGGYVCTNGTCTQVAPLDGLGLDLNIQATF